MKNLCSGSQCEGFQFLLIVDLWGVRFHAAVVFGLGKDFLFESTLEHCVLPVIPLPELLPVGAPPAGCCFGKTPTELELARLAVQKFAKKNVWSTGTETIKNQYEYLHKKLSKKKDRFCIRE